MIQRSYVSLCFFRRKNPAFKKHFAASRFSNKTFFQYCKLTKIGKIKTIAPLTVFDTGKLHSECPDFHALVPKYASFLAPVFFFCSPLVFHFFGVGDQMCNLASNLQIATRYLCKQRGFISSIYNHTNICISSKQMIVLDFLVSDIPR